MDVLPCSIPEVLRLEPRVHEDHRGFFFESWNRRDFAARGLPGEFVQDNHSRSAAGTLRGLHYQLRRPQGKLVRVVIGEVYDVAVDLRRGSPTFGRWVGNRLSAENRAMVWVPAGFAHGFYVTTPVADLLYKATEFYDADDEHVLRWDDPEVGIDWPLEPGRPPVLSRRDAAGSLLRHAECFP